MKKKQFYKLNLLVKLFKEDGILIKRSSWSEFRDTGLLWLINSILHLFGWCIVIERDDNNSFTGAYPAKTDFRGFSEKSNTKNYKKITEYMVDNSAELLKAFKEDSDEED